MAMRTGQAMVWVLMLRMMMVRMTVMVVVGVLLRRG